jgi:hypothetical protein
MMKNFLTHTLALLFLLVGVQQAHAQQAQVKVGPRLGFDRYGFRYFAGVDARFTLPGLALGPQDVPLILNPTLNYYFSVGGPSVDISTTEASLESGGTLYQVGANVLVDPTELTAGEGPPFGIYLGGGLALSRVSYEQTLTLSSGRFGGSGGTMTRKGSSLVPGLNLTGSATFPVNALVTPFAQFRITLAPRASVDLQKSVDGEAALFSRIPESLEYQSWGGTSFAALSIGILFGL